MSVKDFINLDISDVSKMTRKDLAKATSVLGSAVNKRVKRFNEKGIATRATEGLKKSGGNISVKGKNVNQLRQEFLRAKKFIDAKTSTYKGYVRTQKEIEKRLGGSVTPEQSKLLWSAYNKISEIDGYFNKLYGSEQAQAFLRDEIINNPNISMDNLITKGIERINILYEQNEGSEDEMSNFFELGGNW